MNEPIRLRTCCDGTGWLDRDKERRCACTRESACDALDRVTAEKRELVRTVDELSLVVVELEAERDQLRAEVQRLRGHRIMLLDALSEQAAALRFAGNYERAKRLMSLVREVADG